MAPSEPVNNTGNTQEALAEAQSEPSLSSASFEFTTGHFVQDADLTQAGVQASRESDATYLAAGRELFANYLSDGQRFYLQSWQMEVSAVPASEYPSGAHQANNTFFTVVSELKEAYVKQALAALYNPAELPKANELSNQGIEYCFAAVAAIAGEHKAKTQEEPSLALSA